MLLLYRGSMMTAQSVNMTIPFGQSEDVKIVDFGSKAQVSLWYDRTDATTYFKNNTGNSYYVTLAYYDGHLNPTAGATLQLAPNDQYTIDLLSGNVNNQQLAISNASLTLTDSSEVVFFDYNNVCVYNDEVTQNTILLSIDSSTLDTSHAKSRVG